MRPKVLLVEDSTSLAILYKQYVKDEAYDLLHVETGKEAKNFILNYAPQLVILDLQLPDISGQEILEWIQENEIPSSVIIATAHGSVDVAISLIQRGAKDFLEKPIQAERLKTSIRIHLKNAKLEHLVEDLENSLDRSNFHGFIGSSVQMQAVYKTIDSVAPTNASVFINGESGTGKEVCAEAIHRQSDRKNRPFIAINCGAIPRDLMESEIFGHVRGAFTGATTDRKGAAMQAHGGTLFLDELCEMELEMQKKLLRFLQTGTFTPLGDSKEKKVDVRIICATNRDPLQEVEEGRFREDLYYRVHVIPIEMPPLRERGKDIITLANHFLKIYAKQDGKKFTGLDKQVQQRMKCYRWPGNVRQLQNIIRNIVVLNDDTHVAIEHLPAQLNDNSTTKEDKKTRPVEVVEHIERKQIEEPMIDELQTAEQTTEQRVVNKPTHSTIRPMWQVERETIQNAIDFCDGNVLSAAVLLELSPSTVYRKKLAWETEDEHNEAQI
ncbi:sigma-54 dependent transcriptional regulator [Vibrio sp. kj40-1]|uniref:Sigma-54 dependent transcriptional regulator n=1 Tax=Vibrio algarum TaxID=3020714 RepID=A0ABT4YVW7_9VIBR|nr:sigma-54 dependent transcriptional regulator [Vibrio sp. KJ40-1]MDB1125727.1 sigma-54 dependent transcriptional regulator [Vibrio sp. KJ40-1]